MLADTSKALVANALTTAGFTLNWMLPFDAVGYRPAMLFMGLLGAACGLFRDPPKVSRGSLFTYAFGYTLLATSTVVIAVDKGFISERIAPAVVFIAAYLSKRLLPVIERGIEDRVREKMGGPRNDA